MTRTGPFASISESDEEKWWDEMKLTCEKRAKRLFGSGPNAQSEAEI